MMRGSRRVARQTQLCRQSLSVAVLTLILFAVLSAPALASDAAAPGWVADSGNAGAYTTSLSCPTANFCVAVNWNGAAVIYNGQGWEARTLKPDQTTSEGTFGVPLTSVSCASASFCVAVDNAGDAFTYDGSAWSSPISIDPGNQLNSVSCPTSTYCEAIDVSGTVFEYMAGEWALKANTPYLHVACYAARSSPQSPNTCRASGGNPTGAYSGPTGGITCLPTPFCMQANSDGTIQTWSGGPSPSQPEQVGSPETGFSGVSCASEAVCVAIDGPDAIFYMYDGTNWTSSKYQGLGRLNAVSCVAGGICVAVDSVGDVVSYPTALPTSLPTAAPTSRTPFISGSLSGLATGRPKLGIQVTDGAGAPLVSKVQIGLPKGLSFNRKAIVMRKTCVGEGKRKKCTKRFAVKGLTVSGATVSAVRLHGGSLAITFKKAASRAKLTFARALLSESAGLRQRVKKHATGSVAVLVKVTDEKQTTTVSLKLKV
jgi:hypothetical protein